MHSYTDDDIQISVVWRMHCFENQQQKEKFYTQINKLSIEQIAQKFKTDLKSRDRLPSQNIKYLDLWTIVIKEYLNYPLNKNAKKYFNFFTFNYCLLPNLMPKKVNEYLLDPFLKHIC